MDIEEFINQLDKFDYGIVAFNTYRLNKENYCFIMIGERGRVGQFMKDECKVTEIHTLFECIVKRLKRLESTGLVTSKT